MDIIENSEAQVIRLDTEPPAYWWEQEEKPKAFTCHIQILRPQEPLDFYLSLDSLLAIGKKAEIFRGQIQESWSNPETDCCGARLPREQTVGQFIGERYRITCKKGYGCKAEQ